MKFTLSWLKEYLDTDASLEDISDTLTAIGLEVEEITDRSKTLADFTVAEILEAKQHPNADRLRVCKVNTGKETLQIVCGAPNARAGIKVALASVGTIIPTNGMKIKQSKIRDIESCGMLCSATELGIGQDTEGIIELPEHAEIGKPFAASMGLDDPLIEIAITPNRGDCLGVYGIARDLAAAGIGTLKPEGVTADDFMNITDDGSFESPVTVSIQTEACPYFIGRTIRGVKNGESPDWLKQRLESVGQKPISTLVDITNYLTLAYGRPAHVYDISKLKGNIVVREAKKGEKLQALDDKKYTLEPGMTTITDDSGAIGLGGIIGGTSTGCDGYTTDVFLEIALFDPINIATTGRKLQIDSDARYRFERGVSMSTLKHFITATQLITNLCGGEVSTPTIAGSLPMERHTITFDPACIASRVGINPTVDEMIAILEKLGFVVDRKEQQLVLGAPFHRPDITIEEDIVEEIARIYGYDQIPATLLPPVEKRTPAITPVQKRQFDLRRLLASHGMQETVTFSFMNSEESKLFGDKESVALDNPISSDLDAMRPSILPNLIQAAKRNIARNFDNLALFEVGPVFEGTAPEQQHLSAGGVRVGATSEKNHYHDQRNIDVFDAKADALTALSLYVKEDALKITQDTPSYYHPGRSGALCLGNKKLGYFGELHPYVAKQLDIKETVVGFEIFPKHAPEPKKKPFQRPKLELSNYQSVNRDFAFVVDQDAPAADVISAIRKADKKLISEVILFDVYQGKGIEDRKKSIAVNVKLQPLDKTLTDEEIEQVSQAIINQVEKTVGGILRV